MNDQKAGQPTGSHSRFFYGYIVVAAGFCIMFATFATRYSFGVFFKPVMNEFDWSRAVTSGAFSLSSIINALCAIIVGALTDKFGPRVISTVCGISLGLGYLLMSQVNDIWQLYLFYGVAVGFGMSGAWVPLLSTVSRWFVARRSLMGGIVLLGSAIGGLIGPPVGDWLISTYSWRVSYLVIGGTTLIICVIAAQFLKRDPAKIGQRPYTRAKNGTKEVKPDIEGFSIKEAIRTRQFWLTYTLYFCFGFSMFTIMVHIAAHATDIGISSSVAANILAAVSGAAIAGRILLGMVADRFGNRQVFIIGFIVGAVAIFWLLPAREVWALYLFAIFVGFIQGGMGAAENPLVAWLFGLRSIGSIFGAISTGFTVGAAVGPFLGGYLFDITGSYQNVFLICAILNIIGLALTIILKPVKIKTIEAAAT